MNDKHQIEELASKYEFTGNESMSVPKALEIKEELEKIDELLQAVRRGCQDCADRYHRHGNAERVCSAG